MMKAKSILKILFLFYLVFQPNYTVGQKENSDDGKTLLTKVQISEAEKVKGFRLEGNGVKPDVEIPFSIKEFAGLQDAVLEKALKTLRN